MTNPEIIVERKKYGSSSAMDYTMRVYQKLNEETIMIDGVKYQKIEEPKQKALLEIIREWNDDDDNPPCEILVDMIESEWLPNDDPHDGEEYQLGWNACLEYLRKKLK